MSALQRMFFPLLLALTWAVTPSLSALQVKPLPGTWSAALTVVALPDGSLLVAQKSGQIDRLAAQGNDFAAPAPWADMGGDGEADLLGLAVDPEYLSSGYLYAALRTKGDHPTVQLTRWRDSGGLVVLNRILVDDLPTGATQAGGVLKVGPDNKLWLGLGDGAAPAADVKPEALRSVLLRYDLDGTIPEDNPNPTSPLWASGLREPSGLAWQPDTERLYELDRGPIIPKGTMDELNLIEKGDFYGWPKYLGRDVVKGVTKPVIYCSSGHSWIPGGAAFAQTGDWKGSLLFAGAGQGVLYRLSLDVRAPSKILFYEELINGDLGPLVDILSAADDQLYLLSKTKLYRINP